MATSKDTDPATVGEQKPSAKVASEDGREAAAAASAQADVDVVAMVSRDANGDPAQTVNYEVLADDDADEDTKAAAHNLAGEALGAKHVKGS